MPTWRHLGQLWWKLDFRGFPRGFFLENHHLGKPFFIENSTFHNFSSGSGWAGGVTRSAKNFSKSIRVLVATMRVQSTVGNMLRCPAANVQPPITLVSAAQRANDVSSILMTKCRNPHEQ